MLRNEPQQLGRARSLPIIKRNRKIVSRISLQHVIFTNLDILPSDPSLLFGELADGGNSNLNVLEREVITRRKPPTKRDKPCNRISAM